MSLLHAHGGGQGVADVSKLYHGAFVSAPRLRENSVRGHAAEGAALCVQHLLCERILNVLEVDVGVGEGGDPSVLAGHV